jgi:uncharacterized membrane protein
MTTVLVFVGTFLASAVEMVEALTIVLAIGVVRGWRSPLIGVAAAAGALAVIVATLGPAVAALPIDALRLVVGMLLLMFGLQWLRKAILRASGHRDMRDENAVFRRCREQAAAALDVERASLDWYAFTVAFKGVLLEGLEVAFIVVTFGSAHGRLPLAAGAAGAALVAVAVLGVIVRTPLERVPENRIAFGVGLLLSTFGCFWAVEGAGVRWPGGELAVLGLLAFWAAVALVLARSLRRRPAPVDAIGVRT